MALLMLWSFKQITGTQYSRQLFLDYRHFSCVMWLSCQWPTLNLKVKSDVIVSPAVAGHAAVVPRILCFDSADDEATVAMHTATAVDLDWSRGAVATRDTTDRKWAFYSRSIPLNPWWINMIHRDLSLDSIWWINVQAYFLYRLFCILHSIVCMK